MLCIFLQETSLKKNTWQNFKYIDFYPFLNRRQSPWMHTGRLKRCLLINVVQLWLVMWFVCREPLHSMRWDQCVRTLASSERKTAATAATTTRAELVLRKPMTCWWVVTLPGRTAKSSVWGSTSFFRFARDESLMGQDQGHCVCFKFGSGSVTAGSKNVRLPLPRSDPEQPERSHSNGWQRWRRGQSRHEDGQQDSRRGSAASGELWTRLNSALSCLCLSLGSLFSLLAHLWWGRRLFGLLAAAQWDQESLLLNMAAKVQEESFSAVLFFILVESVQKRGYSDARFPCPKMLQLLARGTTTSLVH